MDEIHEALRSGEISPDEAVERVLYHPEYGGHRDDAKAVVDEWLNESDELVCTCERDVYYACLSGTCRCMPGRCECCASLPDETEGRRLYRARANVLARTQISMATRTVSLLADKK